MGASNTSQKLTNGPKVLLKNFGPGRTKNEFALLKKLKKTIFETSRLGGSEQHVSKVDKWTKAVAQKFWA